MQGSEMGKPHTPEEFSNALDDLTDCLWRAHECESSQDQATCKEWMREAYSEARDLYSHAPEDERMSVFHRMVQRLEEEGLEDFIGDVRASLLISQADYEAYLLTLGTATVSPSISKPRL